MRWWWFALALLPALLFGPSSGLAGERFIILQSTTSTQNSGLFDHILPRFRAATGIEVRVVAVGTGQALRNAARGDGDAVLVHSPEDEARFVAAGHGILRCRVFFNDFVLVGPAEDPAGIRGLSDVAAALRRIARAGAAGRALFLSRGDDSGTHKKERRLWRAAGLDPTAASGSWYREAGAGMGATLNMAQALGAYTLSDRATWLAFANRRGLALLLEGDERLFNPYGVMVVNPARHPGVRFQLAKAFRDWLISPAGQEAVASFRVQGQQLFFPDVRCDERNES